jgi:Cu(I)-responsive transcriptional regulator
MLTIGKLAKAAGTSVETVRWYEREGLIAAPPRSRSNYRSYGQRDLARLCFIRRARELGFSLDQVRGLLDLSENGGRDCRHVDALAKELLDAIDRRIADLGRLRDELARLLKSCDGGALADCRIVEALSPAGQWFD